MMTERKKGVWSEPALRVLRERYLLKDDAGNPVEDADGMLWRVAGAVASAEENFPASGRSMLRTAEAFYDIMVEQKFLPNSPTLMNAGTGNGHQLSACYVLPVEDSLEGIFNAVKWQALVHASGGGTGFAFSRLRPNGSVVKTTQGVASGPVSFMKIFDAATEQIKQGGKRRGANMGILRVDHPDILDFIACKLDGGITNFNISVAITDAFMQAIRNDAAYDLINPHNGEVAGQLKARDVFQKIVDAAWRSGDPGLVFIDRINQSSANPTPDVFQIEATNPCVTGDTLVYTTEGLRRAADLAAEGAPVAIVADGRRSAFAAHAASPVFPTGVKPVFRLVTADGYELRLTADHRVMTNRGWIPAGDLQPGDRIHLLNRKGGFGAGGSLELGRVLGWVVGDGSIKATQGVLHFFGQEKEELAPAFAGMVETLVEGSQRAARSYTVSPVAIPARNEARVTSVRLHRLLHEHGLTADDKLKVPETVLTGSEGMQRGFLQALFTADGQVSGTLGKGVSVRLTSISRSLLKDVQRLLLNFGIASTLYTERRPAQQRALPDGKGGTALFDCQPYDDLVIAKDNLSRFAREIGFLTEAKQTGLTARLAAYRRGPYKEDFTAKFEALVPDGEEMVYDLTEPFTHSFVANGIVVHNCGEQPLAPFDACNLGSLNLARFVKMPGQPGANGKPAVDWADLERVIRLSVRFLDDVIEINPYPLPEIDQMVRNIRRIGLGVMGWSDMLYLMGIPYDSDEAVVLGNQVMDFITRTGHEESEQLAVERGPFPLWDRSIFKHGKPIRNSTVTTIAPTGTISIIAGCSSGIEPVFALAFRHIVGERRLTFINPVFEEVAQQRGFASDAVMQALARHGSARGVAGIPEDVQRTFVTAFEVSPEWHVRMQAAFQAHTDNGVSKTINLPFEATREDVFNAYMMAWDLGCLGITVFRSGSKGEQVLYVGTDDSRQSEDGSTATTPAEAPKAAVASPAPAPAIAPAALRPVVEPSAPELEPATQMRPRPRRVQGYTYRAETPLGTAFVTVNHDDNDEPMEVFLNVGKAGSDTQAVAEALGRLMSLVLRMPSTLSARTREREIVGQLTGIGGGRAMGFGRARVRSLPDAIAHVLADDLGMTPAPTMPDLGYGDATNEDVQPVLPGMERHFGDLCPECGHGTLVFEEGCQKCYSCGYSEC